MPEIRIAENDDVQVVIEGEADKRTRGDERTLEEIKAETARHREAAQRHRTAAAQYKAEGEHHRVVSALTKAGMEANQAAAEYRSALEAGDIDTQAAATARLAEIEARRVRLLEHEQALHNTPVVPADPVEAACAGRTAATANWLRAHPEHVRDPKKLAKLQSAHFDAEAEGLVPDTSEYFQHIERRVGIVDSAKVLVPTAIAVVVGLQPRST
jgi:hypothetical protein